MNEVLEVLANAGIAIGGILISSIITALGVIITRVVKNFATTSIKQQIVNTVVGAIEQLYPELAGEDKLENATFEITKLFAKKNIKIDEDELRLMIENAVYELKGTFHELISTNDITLSDEDRAILQEDTENENKFEPDSTGQDLS